MGRLAVTINWPYSQLPWSFFSSLWNSDIRLEPDVVLLRAISPDCALSSNMLFETAVKLGADEIFCCDVDQGVPPHVLKTLRGYGKPVVSALTALRQYPHFWSMFVYNPDGTARNVQPTEPLQQVEAFGGGCWLFKADILQKIPKPWHKTEVSADGTKIDRSGEFTFFKKVKEAGIPVYVDTTLESPHYTELVLCAQTLGRQIPHIEVLTTTQGAKEDAQRVADEVTGRALAGVQA